MAEVCQSPRYHCRCCTQERLGESLSLQPQVAISFDDTYSPQKDICRHCSALGGQRGTGDVGRLEEVAEVALYFTILRYSKRSLTAICHPDTAGSASALSSCCGRSPDARDHWPCRT